MHGPNSSHLEHQINRLALDQVTVLSIVLAGYLEPMTDPDFYFF